MYHLFNFRLRTLLAAVLKPVLIAGYLLVGTLVPAYAQTWTPEDSATMELWPVVEHVQINIGLSGDGTTYAVGEVAHQLESGRSGRVIVRRQNGETYDEYLLRDTTLANFGWTVKLSRDGKTLAVGGKIFDASPTRTTVKVYDLSDEGEWVERPNAIVRRSPDIANYFELSDDGGSLLIVQPQEPDEFFLFAGVGMIEAFDWTDGQWVRRGEALRGAGENSYLGTHYALSGDGNTIMASDISVTRVFVWSGTEWEEHQTPIPHDGALSLNESGNTVAVGIGAFQAWENPQPGSVRVFERRAGAWRAKGTVFTGESEFTNLGASLALSDGGNTLIIGAPSHPDATDSSTGHATVYRYENGAWNPLGPEIASDNTTEIRHLGRKVALSSDGTTALVAGGVDSLGTAILLKRQIPTDVSDERFAVTPIVFPVPVTNGQLYIKHLPEAANGEYGYAVISPSGRILQVGRLTEAEGLLSARVDGLPPGMYVLEVMGPEGRSGYRFVVQ